MAEILSTPYGTRMLLDEFGIRARKKYGQNFLTSLRVAEGILDAAEITKEDTVLEIGPGIGSMTQLLSKRAGRVVAVEVDESLQEILAKTLGDCPNVEVIYADILKADLASIAAERGIERFKCVANLPYYITTPILMHLLHRKELFESITVMVQAEVAERMCAQPGEEAYGALSLAIQYYSIPETALSVPPDSFFPRPGVDSSVVHLKARREAPVPADEELLFAVIRASFNQRRKTLANGLTHGLVWKGRHFGREEVAAAIEAAGLPAGIRGEKLGLPEFSAVAQALEKEG